MKRMRILGLALVAVFALVALVGVSSASATAKFGECVGFKHGKYDDANCTVLHLKKGVPAAKGHFEFVGAGECYAHKHGAYNDAGCTELHLKKGVPAPKGKFEKVPLTEAAVSGGPPLELVGGKGTITCTSVAGFQKITSPTTVVTQTLFKGCQLFGQKCENVGPGEIATFLLDGALVEPSAGKAAIHLTGTGVDGKGSIPKTKPHEGEYLAEFGCVSVAFVRVHGELGGALTPVNTMTTTTESTFAAGVEQNLETEFGNEEFTYPPTEEEGSEQIAKTVQTAATNGEIHVGP